MMFVWSCRFVSTYDGHSEIRITLDAGVVCHIHVGPDFPSISSQVAVKKLEGVVGWNEDVLRRVGVRAMHCASALF